MSVVGRPLRVECGDRHLHRVVQAIYGCLPAAPRGEDQVFRLWATPSGWWAGSSPSGARTRKRDLMALVSWFDDRLTIDAQERRPELLFVHAAGLARNGRALLLAAESGGGKSTTAWGAIHNGFSLLSDELAPLDPATLAVHSHARAVCLKSRPPRPYTLPAGTLRTTAGFHVPPALLPRAPARGPVPLAAVVFVSYRPGQPKPDMAPIGAAETAARLYANSLNPLAHRSEGLDTVLALAGRVPGFVLHSGDLRGTSLLLRRTFDSLRRTGRGTGRSARVPVLPSFRRQRPG